MLCLPDFTENFNICKISTKNMEMQINWNLGRHGSLTKVQLQLTHSYKAENHKFDLNFYIVLTIDGII